MPPGRFQQCRGIWDQLLADDALHRRGQRLPGPRRRQLKKGVEKIRFCVIFSEHKTISYVEKIYFLTERARETQMPKSLITAVRPHLPGEPRRKAEVQMALPLLLAELAEEEAEC